MIAQFSLNAEDKESAEARNARYDKLKEQIGGYYGIESPWKGADDVDLEATLFELMNAEVSIWQLHDNLTDRNDDDNAREAVAVGTWLHEVILKTASKALSRLRAHPNPRLLQLLIAQLEAYPYIWADEEYGDLLPNLQKLQKTRKKRNDSN